MKNIHIDDAAQGTANQPIERLVAIISSSFVDTTDLDVKISNALKSIGLFCSADRAYVFQIRGQAILTNTHEWCAEGVRPQIEHLKKISAAEELPWFWQHMQELKDFYVPSVAGLPAEAVLEKQHFDGQDIKSLVVVPMASENTLLGFLGFDWVREKREWSDDVVALLRLTAETIGRALERNRTLDMLSRKQHLLHQTQEIAHLGSWELDLVDNILTWSDEAYKIFGVQPQEFGATYEAFLEVVHPDERAAVDAAYTNSLREERDGYDIEHRIVHKATGEVRIVHEKCIHVHDATGRLVRSTGMVQDITDKKKMEMALRRSESFANAIVASEPACIKVISPDGLLQYMNPAGLAMLQAENLEAVRGRPVESFVVAEHRDAYRNMTAKVLKGEEGSLQFEMTGLRGARRWLHAHAVPMRDEQGNVNAILCLTRDVTGARMIEDFQLFLAQSGGHIRHGEFFHSLAVYLAEKLEIDMVCIDRLTEGNHAATTLVLYFDGKFEDNLTYTLKDTPCGEVVERKVCLISSGVCQLFPNDKVLQDMKAESYAGTILWGHQGKPIGLIALIWREPLKNNEVVQSMLQLVGARAAGELERMLAEEQVIESKRMLQAVLDTIPVRVFWKDLNSVYLGGNRPFALDAGLSMPDELLGKDDYAMGWREQADVYRADDRQVMTSNQPKLDFEELQTTPDGRKITLRTSKIPLKDASGSVYGLLGTYEDITERKQVEESLKDSESRYREMFEQTMDYILVLEPVENGPPIIVDASESAFRRHGYSREEIIGKPITMLDPDDAKVAINVDNILRDGFSEFEVVHKCKDGTTFPARVISRVINIKGRRHFYSVERDITREKLAESQLNVLSTAIEQSPTSIVITDAAGNIDYVNPKFTRLTGYSFDEARGQNPRILKSGAQPSEVYEELWKTIASGEVWRGEFCNKKKNGDLYWERVVISPVKDQAGTITHFLAVKEDITELKKSEGEKKGLEAQLRQAQKMETIGTLAGGIAHDFNNILQPVNSCSEMLRSRLPADSPLMKYVDLMSRSVDRGRDLVKQLLTFSRQKEQEKRPIRLQPIIAETLSMISSLVPATVNIRMEIDQNCRPVMADPIQIQQIIMNLCTNACDAMNKNGTLTVQLEAIELDEAAARDNLRLQSGRYALIVVRDTGDGMDEDTQKRIFDPFFTTKEIGKGTGLGLSVVHGIIMECSGEIVVDSSPGSGTSFKVYLPCTEKIAVEPVVVQGAAMVGGAGTILFVDDEEDITSISREMLEDLGYIVTALNSAADAIEELRRKPDMYDLIISDYAMPAMTGDRFAAEARKICPGIPVILITGNNEAIPAEKLRDIAAREIVSKPFRMQEIGEAISRALNSAQ